MWPPSIAGQRRICTAAGERPAGLSGRQQILRFCQYAKVPACAHPMLPTGADRKFLVMMPDRTTKFFLGSGRVKPGHPLRAGRVVAPIVQSGSGGLITRQHRNRAGGRPFCSCRKTPQRGPKQALWLDRPAMIVSARAFHHRHFSKFG